MSHFGAWNFEGFPKILLTLYGNNDIKNLSGETLSPFVAESRKTY
jgi:hypothetical protein